MLDPETMTPEQMQVEFDKQFGEALKYVLDVVKNDKTGVVRNADPQTEHNLVLIDRFIQAMYYGNLKEGNLEEAIIGLMTGVRAAFLVGYKHNDDTRFKQSFGPVSSKDLQ